MTKRDFELLAQMMAELRPEGDDAWIMWKLTVKTLAERLAKTNPRFDVDRFFKACDFN